MFVSQRLKLVRETYVKVLWAWPLEERMWIKLWRLGAADKTLPPFA